MDTENTNEIQNETPKPTPPKSDTPKEKTQTPIEQLPPDIQEYISQLRSENAERRTQNNRLKEENQAATTSQENLIHKLQNVLGIQTDNEPTVESLTEQVAQYAKAEKQARLEFAIWRTAEKLGANAATLLDSKAFSKSLDGIDPQDDDAIEKVIKETMKTNPLFAKTPPVTASTVEHAPSPGGNEVTQEQFNKMTIKQRMNLFKTNRELYNEFTGN